MNELFFYAVTNPDDALSQQIIDKNRRDLDFWRNQLPDDDADLATTILRINLRTGLPRKFIAASLFTVRFLRDLPAVRTLVDKLGHLDLPRLNTITRALAKVPSRFLTLFDEHVASYLTPHPAAPGAATTRVHRSDAAPAAGTSPAGGEETTGGTTSRGLLPLPPGWGPCLRVGVAGSRGPAQYGDQHAGPRTGSHPG